MHRYKIINKYNVYKDKRNIHNLNDWKFLAEKVFKNINFENWRLIFMTVKILSMVKRKRLNETVKQMINQSESGRG